MHQNPKGQKAASTNSRQAWGGYSVGVGRLERVDKNDVWSGQGLFKDRRSATGFGLV